MIDPVAFYIGPIGVRWYGIIIGFAVTIALILINREVKLKKLDEEFFLDFFIIGLPAAIIGARLYYVLFRWELYRDNLLRIFALREGGLAIHGGILAGVLVLLYMTERRDISFWTTVDILSPSLLFGQAIGRWGNFINQEAYGRVVSSDFISIFPDFIQEQMFIRGNYHHPTFLYESIWNIMLFIFLIYLRKKEYLIQGDIFLLYIMGYSLGRFFIEGLRTDSLMLGPIRAAQFISIIGIVLAFIFIIYRHRKSM